MEMEFRRGVRAGPELLAGPAQEARSLRRPRNRRSRCRRAQILPDAAWTSGGPARMLRGVPIRFEESAGSKLPRQISDFAHGLCCFCQRRRIGNLKMQRRDLGMEEIAAVSARATAVRPPIFALNSTGK